MRWLSRFLGLLLAAGAFVSFVIDGARSIADNTPRSEPVGALWSSLHGSSFEAFRIAVEQNLSPLAWNHVIAPALMLPVFAVLLLLAALFLFIGRRPRSRIGYAVRG